MKLSLPNRIKPASILLLFALTVFVAVSTPAGRTSRLSTPNRVRRYDSSKIAIQSPKQLSISLNGENPLKQECSEPFTDPGAAAKDSSGHFFPVELSGSVDVATPGDYTLTYTASDGQNSVQIDRKVNVVDTTAPGISLAGGKTMTVPCGQAFVEPGATATDACEGSLPLTISGTVDTNITGIYVITYSAADKYENRKTVTRTVIVGSPGEETPPTLTLNGKAQMKIECGEIFTDPGATAITPCSGEIPVNATGTVNVLVPESYYITYTATSSQFTVDKTRSIDVVDTLAPVISLKGPNPMNIQLGHPFDDPGATAEDGCAGILPIRTSGKVDELKPGSYTITYFAKDPSGNEATPVTRTVNIVKPPPLSKLMDSCSLITGVRGPQQLKTIFQIRSGICDSLN